MGKTLLEIRCKDGSITITTKLIHGIFFYQLSSFEILTNFNTHVFVDLEDAWVYLKLQYPKWYQLYLVQISTQMTEIIKKDFIMACDKNEHTIDSWLVQLFGIGLGF